MALTKEQSEELALQLIMINVHAQQIDLEYAQMVVDSFKNQASRQEALSVLNPMHPQAANDRLRVQAEALRYLLKFIELSKKADELKATAESDRNMRQTIQQLFI